MTCILSDLVDIRFAYERRTMLILKTFENRLQTYNVAGHFIYTCTRCVVNSFVVNKRVREIGNGLELNIVE